MKCISSIATYLLVLCLLSSGISGCASQQTRLVQGKTSFIEQDYHQAFKTLQPLAVQGLPDAQYAVGYMYYYGYGTPKNNQLALKWMQSAAAKGQPDAVKALNVINSAELQEANPNPVFTPNPPNYQQDIQAAVSANQASQ